MQWNKKLESYRFMCINIHNSQETFGSAIKLQVADGYTLYKSPFIQS